MIVINNWNVTNRKTSKITQRAVSNQGELILFSKL